MEKSSYSYVFVLLLVTAGLADVATDIYVPALPLLADAFIASDYRVQLTMSLHLVGFVCGQPFFGALCDSWGRRPALLAGLVLFLLGSLGCALAPTLNSLIVFRLVQGMGACSAPLVAIATVRDLYEGRSGVRALSLLTATMALSPVIGPVIGSGMVAFWSWRFCFGAVAVGVALCFLALWFLMVETLPREEGGGGRQKRSLREYVRMLKDPFFVGCLVYNGMMVATAWLFVSIAPGILRQEYGISPGLYGYFQASTMVLYAAGCALAACLIMAKGSRPLILVGLSGSLLSAAALVTWARLDVAHPPLILFLLTGLFLASFSLIRPSVIHLLMGVYPTKRGLASSWLGMSEMVFAALSIEVFARLYPKATAEHFAVMLLVWSLLAAATLLVGTRLFRADRFSYA